jgi:oligoendopeptidase F
MKRTLTLLTLILVFASATFAKQEGDKTPDSKVDAKYSWDLSQIYSSWDEWSADLEEAKSLMTDINSFKGRLNESPEVLIELLNIQENLQKKFGRVYRYPAFMRSLNSLDQDATLQMQKLMSMFAAFNTATSWITPEFLTIPKEKMAKWIEENKELEPYRFNLMDQYRLQEHVLDAEKEELLSYFSKPMSTASAIYDELSTSDIKFPTITLSTGEEIELTHGNYAKYMETSDNQKDREQIFNTYYQMYKDNENTYAAIYKGICEKNNAWANARGYEGTLQAKLEGNNIPVSVYESLIKTAYDNVDPLQRYMKLRKKMMGLETMYMYDLSTKLSDFKKEYTFDEGVDLVKEAVKPLGDDYYERISNATKGGWIDVYEKPNKTSGAYSANVYGVHPYILMNWNKSLNHVFTLAHELGHSMHSIYSNENQPYATHSYTIFVAEVASTFNEQLLLNQMIEDAKTSEEKIALLQQAIENIWGTFYVQSLFADYEYRVHKLVEQGQPVTAQVLNGIMNELYTHYYGDAVVQDELSNVKWARVPHFFGTPYYVYQYATSFSASSAIYMNYKNAGKKDKKEIIEKYKTLLKSGGNDFPVAQLQKAGVDLTTNDPFKAVVAQMDELVTKLETELEKL